jgi:hypothetical protein
MKKDDNPEDIHSDSEEEFELLEDNAIVSIATDQPLTYTQMMTYSVSNLAKTAFIYSSGKLAGCLTVAVAVPTAYVMAANYFTTPAASGILSRSTNSAVVSASYDLGNYAGRQIAETTWNVSSTIITRTLTYAYNGSMSKPEDTKPKIAKNAEKNKKKKLGITE